MSLFALSISHHTASVDTLARAWLPPEAQTKLCHALVESDPIAEAVVLSTCNRTEVYADIDRFHAGLDQVVQSLASATGLSAVRIQDSCAVFFDEGTVAHTFAVAGGLDSVVVGESQVLGQYRDALANAQLSGTVGSALNALFQQGIRVGKRVHTETEIGRAGRSMVDAAYDRLREVIDFDGARILVVGAGQMATLAARTAAAEGARVTVMNRTAERADRLAQSLPGGESRPLESLIDALADVDAVVSCTGAADVLITTATPLPAGLRAVVDLAMPPDVDPMISGPEVINIATIAATGAGAAQREQVRLAQELVAGEVVSFQAGRHARSVTPTVVALRSMAADVVSGELTRLDARLPELDPAVREELRRTVQRVADKLIHAPTVRVQQYAADTDTDYAAALRTLFALDPHSIAAVMSPEVRR